MTAMKSMPEVPDWRHSEIVEKAETVIVFLHGMHCGPLTVSDLIDGVRREAKKKGPSVSLLVPDMPLRWHACFDVAALSRNIAGFVADQFRGRQVRELIIAGHSAGGLLAQSVYLDLVAPEDPSVENAPKVLSPLVSMQGLKIRLALIAPMTRGWEISHHLPPKEMIAWKVGSVLSQGIRFREWLTGKKRPLWIRQVRKGSSFIVNLRLRWLELQQRASSSEESAVPLPEIVTLLGSVDEIISWRDMVDTVHPEARYLEVPRSNHAQIVDVMDPREGDSRMSAILSAMFGNLQGETSPPADEKPLPVDREVKRMVFVIHGIRDLGHWTQKIGMRCKAKYDHSNEAGQIKAGRVAIETSSYGFFSMLEFLLTSAKSAKVQWLVEEYVEAKRRFPEAKFTYIGHSNGTYLLAEALEHHPRMAFQRIAFAGSVVNRSYDWAARRKRGQVESILNFTADGDWVVAFFPRLAEFFPFLRPLLGRHLGGAGVMPFPEDEHVKSNDYVRGGHGAAIDEWNWDHLAKFAVSENLVIPSEDPERDPRYTSVGKWFCRPGISVLAVGMLVLAVLWLARLAWINPLYFWGGSLAIALPPFAISLWYASLADSKPFAEKKKIERTSGMGFGLMAALVMGWLFVPGFLWGVDWLHGGIQWLFHGTRQSCSFLTTSFEWWVTPLRGNRVLEALCSETMRTLSVIAYLLGLYRVFTRF